MIRQKKTEKVIPGYTGYIPRNKAGSNCKSVAHSRDGHIPGYAGYIPKIKPENLYGKTFGQITYDIQMGRRDHYEQFMSSNKQDFIDSQFVEDKPV